MEKWDVHTHTTLSPDTWQALERFTRYADFVRVRAHDSKPCGAQMVNSRGEVVREIEANAYDGAVRIKECDAHGVTVQVLSPTPMMIPDTVDNAADAAEICRILNDDNAATAAKFPKRFVALGALPMRHPNAAVKELERIRALGMRGVEINTHIDGADLDDPAFFLIFEAAAELGMAVFVHPWGGFMTPTEPKLKARMNAKKNWRPWLIGMGTETALAFDALRCGGVHERLPHLRVLYAHGGGVFPALLGRLDHGPYCRPDLFTGASSKTPWQTVRDCGVYVDTLTHNPYALKLAVDTLGVERVAMGSDYPYPLGEMDPHGERGLYPGYLVEHLDGSASDSFPWIGKGSYPQLTQAQRQRILSGTAKEWLGLDKK